ncbi:STAS domain-containing protein [Streptomyces sp. NBC_01166]|uniref:STAS domain-containing protein n=1 Tax=Streptomyces sp. NBC_01166 TaxID=2903755 RepID=UPI00386EC18A|nr:STAS domain-containing protein [Streptomyces sp. NBC_01166]
MTADEPAPSRPAPLPVVSPTGELDMDSITPLAAEIEIAIAHHDSIVLDASGITFGDSMFLRLVLSTHHKADLRIAAPSPAITRLFRVIGADTVLRIYPTLKDALAA